jgi:hypothetical protein
MWEDASDFYDFLEVPDPPQALYLPLITPCPRSLAETAASVSSL